MNKRIRKVYKKDEKEYEYLTEKFRKIDIEEQRVKQDEIFWEDRLRKEQERQNVYHTPAKHVQKLYRGWKGREVYKKLKKSKSKKGIKKKKWTQKEAW